MRRRFDEQYKPPPLKGDCSIEFDVDDMLLEVQDTGSSFPLGKYSGIKVRIISAPIPRWNPP
ncbi:hypothetical protein BN2476_170219 [Paraburkholderia piptadeniae]|uniref:Uncharacterized protein n=1 Tax=Paraburkholderia piptadeniae TaxID=1701573 RepID=A0A1N7RU23_9BURK|nr:hypothetical protein BN2476_170219 [Paraburkholderia piptadeniae]